jgi:hypothetical protein
MKTTLLSLSQPDSKHPPNTLAVATIQFTLDSAESIIVGEYRVIKNSRPGPDYVVPPARWGADNRRVPVVVTSRKTLREVEDLILEAYAKLQTARLDSDADDSSAGSSLAGGAR